MIESRLKDKVVKIKRVSDRIIVPGLIGKREIIHIVNVYAPKIELLNQYFGKMWTP